MNGYPVQPAKVQAPVVRDDTLTRDRLIDWLAAKIHSRVVLVIADAGYGKTTLLADFSRRTRVRTFWYRLHEGDGDWVSFLGHLVAAGRQHEAEFGRTTYDLLGDVASGALNREMVTNAFIRDLSELGDAGIALVLDDFHLVDASPDVRYIVREVLARAPERVSVVISSRRRPTLPLARLRSHGEVAELGVDDLRFDLGETERLFRETYRQTIEPDQLLEVYRRTEGWAASLHLVQTALRDRTPTEIRAFIQGLSLVGDHLYDYLAEEVLGELTAETQQFLMSTSVLEFIDIELATLVTGTTVAACRRQLELVEGLGLLGRRPEGNRATLGYHPLVRDVLQERLRRESGDDAIDQLHLRVATFAEGRDWHLACHHFAAANQRSAVGRVVDDALPTIMGNGAFLAAAAFLDRFEPPLESSPASIIRSRVALGSGDVETALLHARAAAASDGRTPWALANLTSINHTTGQVEDAAESARLLQATPDPDLARIGRTTLALLQSPDRPIGPTIRQLHEFAAEQSAKGRLHYAGIAYLNAASLARVAGDAATALSDATSAITALEMSSAGHELGAALITRAWAHAHLGDLLAARAQVEAATIGRSGWALGESLIEAGLIEVWYGSLARGREHLDRADEALIGAPEDRIRALRLAQTQVELRERRPDSALSMVLEVQPASISAWPEQRVQLFTLRCHCRAQLGDQGWQQDLAEARRLARHQQAGFWRRYVSLLETIGAGRDLFGRRIRVLLAEDPALVSVAAELVAPRLHDLDDETFDKLTSESSARPERWRDVLRRELDAGLTPATLRQGQLLAKIGEREDVIRLRSSGRTSRAAAGLSPLALSLARSVADRVEIEDQLRVVIKIGDREITGTQIRRKVLGLLCFLLSRPGFAATRDQIVDALWPDLDPAVAMNSLNQTVYFLRRVFEPEYKEDVSPGFVHHSTDVLWLDGELVRSRSDRCRQALERAEVAPTPQLAQEVSDLYLGKFALDFAYEEWATNFRDSLHVAYLQVIEKAIRADIATGHYDRAIRLARRAVEIDPDAEHLEVSLLRLYRITGAHAAAAEQYAHYAEVQRQVFGVEPAPLEAI